MINITDQILKQKPKAEGGEGIIHEYSGKILKIYKPSINLNEKLKKIKFFMKKNLPTCVVAPVDLVYYNQQFIGYAMEKVSGEELKMLGNKKFVTTNNIKIKDITKMLIDIKNTLTELHKQNIFIGDLNDKNILFDKNYNIYFIDIDSWTIDGLQCTVCMETFKDPLLIANQFSEATDYYAYSILVFKSLTRMHPFGGTMEPDLDIIERMRRGISVIDNPKVIVPKNINGWKFFSPKLLKELKEIYETNKRFLINNIEDFFNNLKICGSHGDYYYEKFRKCPVCFDDAKIIEAPIKITTSTGIPYVLIFGTKNVKLIYSLNLYLDQNDMIINRLTDDKTNLKKGIKSYFSDDGFVLYEVEDEQINIMLKSGKKYSFEKTNKSPVLVKNKTIYYINQNNSLVELIILDNGTFNRIITKVAFNTIFDIYNKEHYFICNMYDNMTILNIDGYMEKIDGKHTIRNYGIHFDEVTKKWLFIYENDSGKFTTLVYNKNKKEYENNSIKYLCDLGNICFNNKIIFKPGDKLIRGFSYDKNIYKDFPCEIVNEDSKLIKTHNKFIVINEKEIYKVG